MLYKFLNRFLVILKINLPVVKTPSRWLDGKIEVLCFDLLFGLQLYLSKNDIDVSVHFHLRYEYDFEFETVAKLIPYIINIQKKRGPKASLNLTLKL